MENSEKVRKRTANTVPLGDLVPWALRKYHTLTLDPRGFHGMLGMVAPDLCIVSGL